MKGWILVALVSIGLMGCFPNYDNIGPVINQDQYIFADGSVCFDQRVEFDHYYFHGAELSDSVQWYAIRGMDTSFLGEANPISIPVNIPANKFYCYQFSNGDTVLSTAEFSYCLRSVFIPTSFTPRRNDGLNDVFKIEYNFQEVPPSEVYMRIMAMDGLVVFETGNPEIGWDGTYDGLLVPPGPYLVYIDMVSSIMSLITNSQES